MGRLKPLPPLHPKLRLKRNPTTDTDTDTTPVLMDTVDTDIVTLAKGPLKPNLSLTTDTVDTDMVDTVDTTAVDTTGVTVQEGRAHPFSIAWGVAGTSRF